MRRWLVGSLVDATERTVAGTGRLLLLFELRFEALDPLFQRLKFLKKQFRRRLARRGHLWSSKHWLRTRTDNRTSLDNCSRSSLR